MEDISSTTSEEEKYELINDTIDQIDISEDFTSTEELRTELKNVSVIADSLFM
jgi:hypothetical protein